MLHVCLSHHARTTPNVPLTVPLTAAAPHVHPHTTRSTANARPTLTWYARTYSTSIAYGKPAANDASVGRTGEKASDRATLSMMYDGSEGSGRCSVPAGQRGAAQCLRGRGALLRACGAEGRCCVPAGQRGAAHPFL
eukprot:6733594-Prymnesium_polylepis.1